MVASFFPETKFDPQWSWVLKWWTEQRMKRHHLQSFTHSLSTCSTKGIQTWDRSSTATPLISGRRWCSPKAQTPLHRMPLRMSRGFEHSSGEGREPGAGGRQETHFGGGPGQRGCDLCPGCCSSSGDAGTGAGTLQSTQPRPGRWHASHLGGGGTADAGGSPGLAHCRTSPWRSRLQPSCTCGNPRERRKCCEQSSAAFCRRPALLEHEFPVLC